MIDIYGDMHIHIGRAMGKAVKITASRQLQLRSIIFHDAPLKGLNMVGVVDAGTVMVAAEIEKMLESGELIELDEGGFLASNGVLLIAGCETECREGVHLISYLPDLQAIRKWQAFLRSRVHNMQLSTQKADASMLDIMEITEELGGVFCPAHAYTPHKGVYGKWLARFMDELGEDTKRIKVLELGLSADSSLADRIEESWQFTYLSNSDAHSSPNVGREYNLFRMGDKSFQEWRKSIENQDGRHIAANYGMDPRLGKYHRSYCPQCETILDEEAPVITCAHCGNKKIIMGVYDRIVQIQDHKKQIHPEGRPAYHYRVPLKDLPGVGPKIYNKLLQIFPGEINLLENIAIEEISRAAGPGLAASVEKMRRGQLDIIPGGGGKYGRVKKNTGSY